MTAAMQQTVEDAWPDVYPLSLRELTRLSWLRTVIEAREFLGMTNQYVSLQEAQRLSFLRYLVVSRRVGEFV